MLTSRKDKQSELKKLRNTQPTRTDKYVSSSNIPLISNKKVVIDDTPVPTGLKPSRDLFTKLKDGSYVKWEENDKLAYRNAWHGIQRNGFSKRRNAKRTKR